MTTLTKTELQSIINTPNKPCISIYLPTHEAGRETRQDPIRLKNQIAEAQDQLKQQGISDADAQAILEPANQLLEEDNEFWQHQQSGLVLFLAPNEFRSYRVPLKLDTFTQVSDRFYIKPLTALSTDNAQFYILAASQSEVTLYQATRDQIQTVDLGNTPRSLEVALRYDDPEASLQGHGTGRGGERRVFHGQGGGKDSQNTDILRFFHLVSNGVEEAIGGQNVPLIFAGLPDLFAIYKETNKYSHLLEDAVEHHSDELSAEEIHERALKVAEPYFAQNRQAAVEEYGNLLPKGQATDDLAQILSAAHDGQVDTLFIAEGSRIWGTFNAAERTVIKQSSQPAEAPAEGAQSRQQPTGDSEELLDMALSLSLTTGADIYVVAQSDMPTAAEAAAILRYPIMVKATAVS
ncbi:MAG: hypothetical protein AAFY72_03985, partial [Cyanobacteria bacterium J06649_4]